MNWNPLCDETGIYGWVGHVPHQYLAVIERSGSGYTWKASRWDAYRSAWVLFSTGLAEGAPIAKARLMEAL